MKALWLREVQAILAKEDFREWWQVLIDKERERERARERHEELLAQASLTGFRAELTQKNAIDALYQSGELEDSAALLLAESAEIENKAYEAVADFESKRLLVSDLYSQMGAAEHNFLSAQSEIEEIEATLEEAFDEERHREISRRLKRKRELLSGLDRRLHEASATYERGSSRKVSIWEEVEQLWARSLDINLGVAESRARGRRVRKTAERLFQEAEQHKQAAERLASEAEEASREIDEIIEAVEQQRSKARRLFGCIVGEEFLYWPRRENDKEVYCMPVGDHAAGFNIELQARSLYLVSRQQGVEFIEPIPPNGVEEAEDSRLDDFFLARGREVDS